MLPDDGPAPLPAAWLGRVNGAETEAELAALRCSVARGSPFGEGPWVGRTAKHLGLESTPWRQGRPQKTMAEGAK